MLAGKYFPFGFVFFLWFSYIVSHAWAFAACMPLRLLHPFLVFFGLSGSFSCEERLGNFIN